MQNKCEELKMKNKEEKMVTIEVKGFLGQLFCNHDYIDFGKKKVFNNIRDRAEDLPSAVYWRLICKKCSKVNKIEL